MAFFLKYTIYVGKNKGRGHIYFVRNKNNNATNGEDWSGLSF